MIASPELYRTTVVTVGKRPAAARRDFRITPGHEVTIAFTINSDQAPALRSVVEEMSALLGGRVVGSHKFEKEQAYTDSIIALGALRAAVNAKVAEGDPNYV